MGYKPDPDVALEAEMNILRNNTCVTGTMRSSAYDILTGPRWQQPEERAVISLILSGEMLPRISSHRAAGAMGLGSIRETGHYRWTQGTRYAFVILPHHDVQAALGRIPDASLSITPAHCALAPALASHMTHMVRLVRPGTQLEAAEYAGMLDAAAIAKVPAVHALASTKPSRRRKQRSWAPCANFACSAPES